MMDVEISRREYKRDWMKKHRSLESDEKRMMRLEKNKMRYKMRKQKLTQEEMVKVRENSRLQKANQRSNLSDKDYIANLQEQRFKYKLRLMNKNDWELKQLKDRVANYSREYRKKIGNTRRNLGIYSSKRKLILEKHREISFAKTSAHYRKTCFVGKKVRIAFNWNCKVDLGFEPYLSYLARYCFLGSVIRDELRFKLQKMAF